VSDNDGHSTSPPVKAEGKRKTMFGLGPFKIVLIAASVARICWQILVTEWNVNKLRARGFGDFVIERTRMPVIFLSSAAS